MKQSPQVVALAWQITHAAKITPEQEYRWHPDRRFRSDLALVDAKILVEVDGGGFVQGGHNRGAARRYDMERDGEALRLGWLTIRMMPEHVKNGLGLQWVEAALRIRQTAK